MSSEKIELRSAGKGFVLAAPSGLPLMRCLVDVYTGTNNKRYIKFDGEILPLHPSHKFIAAN